MIFAELDYSEHYDDVHEDLVHYLQSHFEVVKSGHQGDAWIWIFSGKDKVAIDTFTSMKHQVKCERAESKLLAEVLCALNRNYTLNIYGKPEPGGHEDGD